ncbi:hypothetical protein EML15_00020 [Corynebacterium sp. sy017]|uniref:hypothetical protein n=1 Tax=unclassified Corynebacterium TaxID=2624378 RepID=UPI001185F006|nr:MULTISPECIES: hypothetical protein [unclassified Corynebacterium]MBP3087540.1 hypothetical protein [Corynebacterium sp. sy017]TSD92118.1 hypothetical protein ELY17_00020 [Corynebacterium sp. SY003]
MMSSTGFTSRIYELIGAVFAVCASSIIEVHGFSGFLADSWYPWMYAIVMLATFGMAVYAKRNLQNRWAEQIRTTLFFMAIIFISIALPNDISRAVTIIFAVTHLFIPTKLNSNRDKIEGN